MSKNTQYSAGCAGVKEYPLTSFYNEGNLMTLDEYRQASEDLSASIRTRSYMKVEERFGQIFSGQDDGGHHNLR